MGDFRRLAAVIENFRVRRVWAWYHYGSRPVEKANDCMLQTNVHEMSA